MKRFRRWLKLHSPRFLMWVMQVNIIFVEDYDWPRQMSGDTGLDCWHEAYSNGLTPQEAVDSEVSYWDDGLK